VLRSTGGESFAVSAIAKEINMSHKIARTFMIAAALLGATQVTGVISTACAQQRPVAPNVFYTVVYYHIKYPTQKMYIPIGSSRAAALKVMYSINTNPSYRANLIWR
jgi:hypothetical protein